MRPRTVNGVLTTLPCGVVSFADDGRVLATNATLRTLLGYGEGELEGRHVESLLTIAGRIFYQTHLYPLLRHQGGVQELFLLLRRKDGGEVGALASAVRVERDGATVNDCVLFEVRERRRYENELLLARRVADAASAALATRTHALEESNARLAQQAQALARQQQQMEEQATELESRQEELQAANDALRARTAELERARSAAEEANRAKSQFLTTMSHELRTPLNAIGGYAELMALGLHGSVTEGQRHAIERITRSQRHLLHLVNEVLNLARIESGRVEYAVEEVPLAAMIASVTPMVEPQMAAGRLRFTYAVGADLVARADRDKAQQVVLNMLTNAVKFTPAGGCVRIEAAPDDTGERVLVRVSDTGIGIDPGKLESIFEPFVQVRADLTRTVEGTGLGLAISRDLARGMRGDLTVESRVGVGSTFTLALPRAA